MSGIFIHIAFLKFEVIYMYYVLPENWTQIFLARIETVTFSGKCVFLSIFWDF